MGVPPIRNESYHRREPAASKPLQESGIDTGTKKPRPDSAEVKGARTEVMLRLEGACRSSSLQMPEPGRFAVYLREAQAYMLISMPTCTSTIFGVFQVIGGLPLVLARCSRRNQT